MEKSIGIDEVLPAWSLIYYDFLGIWSKCLQKVKFLSKEKKIVGKM